MIQAIGLTSAPRRNQPPAVDDLTFEAAPGLVTVLLGAPGAGKSTALRLLLQLESGRGLALFRGRPLHSVPHPCREVGVLLGDTPGHPARTARGHLAMLTAAAGMPVSRADDVLELVGLSGLAEQRLGDYSRGMDRRLGLAAALLADPYALVLDEPTHGLSPRETTWLHGLLRSYAAQGGAVLVSAREFRGVDRLADRVVSIDGGRLVADQSVTQFARTRLRPRVAVRSPLADRLGALLAQEARATGERIEVIREGSGRISVYGSSCAVVGEVAYRNGILVHRLADEVGEASHAGMSYVGGSHAAMSHAGGSHAGGSHGEVSHTMPLGQADGRHSAQAPPPGRPVRLAQVGAPSSGGLDLAGGSPGGDPAGSVGGAAHGVEPGGLAPVSRSSRSDPSGTGPLAGSAEGTSGAAGGVPWPTPADEPVPEPRTAPASRALALPRLPSPGPAWPVRYELRRATGVSTVWYVLAATLVASLITGVLLARTGDAAAARALTGWPAALPLPPVAIGAVLLGALAFGQEYRYPALAPTQGAMPRRLALLASKLLVWSCATAALALIAALANGAVLWLLFGVDTIQPLDDWFALLAGWCLLAIGCGWAGLLAAAVFRSTSIGFAAALAVPLLGLPLLRRTLDEPSSGSLVGMPDRMRTAALVEWPSASDQGMTLVARLASEPVGQVMMLSISVLLCAYVLTALRGRPRPGRAVRCQRAK
ncbi:ATP-binding cassette domain-containing protein [Streptomyces zagrosensis]|uniref:ABC-type multidrug transport system ATPase subunit n=1 Tax=Streptomyces zagrosensis TaxID=1042984 RepID=A0A7W9QCD0_9ACTN|nr:ATP-binding cassette domain-containing protein [Streptomyces zagrosensis]MBB5937565.1 ABC-type multidrug transport system ATPase subunit [Streptomyces zagrosensis]